jgi:ribosomal protein S18 acetylase RimI-like enzyme
MGLGMNYHALSYAQAHAWEPLAAAKGVSAVARSARGFMRAYQAAGTFAKLSPYWQRRREGFIARHMAQVKQNGEPLWKYDAAGVRVPSRRALALLMWAYMPPGLGMSAPTHRNPFGPYDKGAASMSDAAWERWAVKGTRLLAQNGIWLDDGVRKIALVEADPKRPKSVIGAAAFYTSSFRNGTITYSFDLAVDERHRGRGIGRLLIDGVLKLIDEAAAFSTEPHIRVDVHVVNDTVLEALRRRGFKIEHRAGVDEWHAVKVLR